MAKERKGGYRRESGGEPVCVANQRIPKGSFDSDGLSQGERAEEVRGHDAYQGPRPAGGESK